MDAIIENKKIDLPSEYLYKDILHASNSRGNWAWNGREKTRIFRNSSVVLWERNKKFKWDGKRRKKKLNY